MRASLKHILLVTSEYAEQQETKGRFFLLVRTNV